MEPLPNENETSSPVQRLLIGAGTLIVVILTVIGAIFLAMQDIPDTPPTEVAGTTPTPVVVTNTPISPSPTNTSQPPPPTNTPLPPPTDTPTPIPPTPTPLPPIDTATPVPPPPTFTLTPAPVEAPGATPVPPPTAPPEQPTGDGGVCAPPASWVTYQVQLGDTLNTLAARTGVSVFDLQQVNCLESFTIQPQQVIYLPFTPPTPTATGTPGPTRTRRPTATRTATPRNPRISDVTVQLDIGADEVVVFVKGENFRSKEQGFRAELVGPTTIPLQIGDARTSTSFEARAPLSQLGLGEYDLVVINPDGGLDIRKAVFPPSDATPTATPAPPEITRVSPSSGQISRDVRLTVQGRNFRPLESGFRVEIQLEDGTLTVELSVDQSVRPATSTSFDAFIPAGTLARGVYDLLVTNPNGQTDIERFAYDAVE